MNFRFRCNKRRCLYIRFLAPLTCCLGAVSLTADVQEAGLTKRLGSHYLVFTLTLNVFILILESHAFPPLCLVFQSLELCWPSFSEINSFLFLGLKKGGSHLTLQVGVVFKGLTTPYIGFQTPGSQWVLIFGLNIILSLLFDFYLKMVTYWVLLIELPYFTGPITNVSCSPQTSTLLKLVDLSSPHLSLVDGITLDLQAMKFPILPPSSHENFVPPFPIWKYKVLDFILYCFLSTLFLLFLLFPFIFFAPSNQRFNML